MPDACERERFDRGISSDCDRNVVPNTSDVVGSVELSNVCGGDARWRSV